MCNISTWFKVCLNIYYFTYMLSWALNLSWITWWCIWEHWYNNVRCCCKYFPFSYNALLLNVLFHLQCPGKVQDIASHYGTISLQMIKFRGLHVFSFSNSLSPLINSSIDSFSMSLSPPINSWTASFFHQEHGRTRQLDSQDPLEQLLALRWYYTDLFIKFICTS